MQSPRSTTRLRHKSMWVKCETPTTGRSYFIHRRTGKISWSDPNQVKDEKIGKYSKRRRSNVAVIIVSVIFISLFLFYSLL